MTGAHLPLDPRDAGGRPGCRVTARVIDAKGYVPQNCGRTFIAGFRDRRDADHGDMDVPGPRRGMSCVGRQRGVL